MNVLKKQADSSLKILGLWKKDFLLFKLTFINCIVENNWQFFCQKNGFLGAQGSNAIGWHPSADVHVDMQL